MNNANNGLYNNLPQFNASGAFDQMPDQGLIDPSAFNPANQNASGINPLDISQFQNSQFAHHRPQGDGIGRNNQSPAFHNSAYQVSSVIPAKRAREDTSGGGMSHGISASNTNNGIGQSPQPNPSSRSQTPQQPHFQNSNFSTMQNANNPFQTPGMYPHLQNSSQSQATPSPTMQHQNFRSQSGAPQRLQSNSPHSMTGSNAPFATPNQMQNNPGRMSTPQNPAMMQAMSPMGMPNQGMMQSPFPGHFAGLNNQTPGQIPPNMQIPDQYRMRLQQAQQHAQQQMQNQAQANQRPGGVSAPGVAPVQQAQNAGPQQQGQARNNIQAQVQSFLKNLSSWCQTNNVTLDPDPRICGKQITWFHLFATITRSGVMNGPPDVKGNWMRLASLLQFPEPQLQQAAMQAKELFEKNLMQYFMHYTNTMAQKRMMAQRGSQRGSQGGGQAAQGSPPPQSQSFGRSAGPQQSMPSPGFISQQGQRSAGQSMSPTPSMQPNSGINTTNGAASPAKVQQQPPRPSPVQQSSNDDPRKQSIGASQQAQQEGSTSAMQTPPRALDGMIPNQTAELQGSNAKFGAEPQASTEWVPVKSPLVTHGGIEVGRGLQLGHEVLKFRPGVPLISELGIVDMHDLSRRLQSGFPSEVTPALDQLVIVSAEIFRLHLKIPECGDLLDALIDCGEQQLEILVHRSGGEAIKSHMPSIDKLTKAAHDGDHDVQERSFMGEKEFELEHAAERIIAISTILRNLSFIEHNHAPLADPSTITFLCHILRLLKSEKRLLRTPRNTLDFMKDVITVLSNVAQKLKFPSKDHASIILDFLLAFAPSGSSLSLHKGHVKFMPYRPTQDQYLPCAVDSLAKLLAHDHPNRFFLKTIFAGDVGRGGDLLTRAFGLVISVVPERSLCELQPRGGARIAGARNSFFSQSMLAADILASLIPDTGRGLAQSWLESDDGWVASLLHLVLRLAVETPPPAPRRTSQGHGFDADAFGFDLIVQHSLSMIQRLVDKSDKQEDGLAVFSTAGWPPLQDAVLDALGENHFDPVALKHLCGLAKCVR